jgi:hypothetical protein
MMWHRLLARNHTTNPKNNHFANKRNTNPQKYTCYWKIQKVFRNCSITVLQKNKLLNVGLPCCKLFVVHFLKLFFLNPNKPLISMSDLLLMSCLKNKPKYGVNSYKQIKTKTLKCVGKTLPLSVWSWFRILALRYPSLPDQ